MSTDDEEQVRAICQRWIETIGKETAAPQTVLNAAAQIAANAILRISDDPNERREIARLLHAYDVDAKPPELIATSPHPIVGMTIYRDRLIVATAEGVFELCDGKFHEIEFVPRSQSCTTE